MIPSVRELLSAHAFLSRRFAWEVSPPHDDLVEALVDARVEAERIAHGGGDEVAALLYACAQRSPAIGEDLVMSAILVALNHGAKLERRAAGDARALSRELLLRAREIAGGALSFAAFEAWLAERLPKPT